jgi:hypothetical protein
MSSREAGAADPPSGVSAGPDPAIHPLAREMDLRAKPAGDGSGHVGEDISAAAEKVAADIGRALAEGRVDAVSAEAIQALMAAACRSYSARVEARGDFPPLTARSLVTSTDVMVTASGLLKSANLAVFELGMWQSWTGR